MGGIVGLNKGKVEECSVPKITLQVMGASGSDFITKTLSKITLIGAVFLAIVAGFPIILGNITGTSIQLGGTTLLIVVGVALETGRSLEGYMTARYHKGFLE